MHLELDLQDASGTPGTPDEKDFAHWAQAALEGRRERIEVTIRLVGEQESAELNGRYRHRHGPTNVLSFPFEPPPGLPPTDLLGDLVICAPFVEREALEQSKAAHVHWAHLVVHGLLHLLGYDHQHETEAVEMERLETAILGKLGFPPPYEEQ
ncbi:MAG: rRNA maturation RNase YbeY [Chromatiaceae bacterium]